MNDLQLHARLSALAADLAPDADPYEQVAAARGLHRRQRRTRIGVAGAVAAVAVLVAGVPTAISTLSAPSGDVAAPSTVEELRAETDAVRAEVERLGPDGSLPDPELGFPCPDAARRLGTATGTPDLAPRGTNAGGGTLTGCGWSTDETAATPPEQRLDLYLQPAFDATPDSVLRELDDRVAEDGCAWTPLIAGDDAAETLLVCPGPQETWTVTLLDDDGTGAWLLTAAVGAELPERDRTAARAVAALWQLVHDLPGPRDRNEVAAGNALADQALDAEDAERQAARSQVVADALADRDPPLELRAGAGRDCPDEAARLTEILGAEIRSEGGSDLLEGCRWSGAGLTLELSLIPGQTEDEMVREVDRSVRLDACHVQAMPSTVDVTPLTLCPAGVGTAWTLRVPDRSGAGYWVLSSREVTGAAADTGAGGLLALVDAAATRW